MHPQINIELYSKFTYDELYDKMYNLIEEYLLTFDLPKEIYLDLIKINKSVVAKPRNLENFELDLNYNI
jgi:hypothetical protein